MYFYGAESACLRSMRNLFPPIVGSVDTPDSAGGVAISGSYAYIADHESGLQIADISDATAPVIVGSIDTPDYIITSDEVWSFNKE